MKLSKSLYILTVAAALAMTAFTDASAQTSNADDLEDNNPNVEILALYQPSEAGNSAVGYVLADTKGKTLKKLQMEIFDSYYNLSGAKTVDLITNPFSGNKVFRFETEVRPYGVMRLHYQFDGDSEETVTPYWDNGEFYDYMSDIPTRGQSGYGSYPGPNKPFGDAAKNKVLELGEGQSNRRYDKGFGFHANGWVETTGDLTPYYRLAAEMGGQVITNTNHTNELKFNIQNGAFYLRTDTVIHFSDILYIDAPINNQQKIHISGNNNGNNTNAVIAIGAPRLFYIPTVKQPQEIVWDPVERIHAYQSVSLPLEASASSGLAVSYRIVKGGEYAKISGNEIIITNFPSDGSAEIIVEAQQPGDATWAYAPLQRKVYTLVKGLEVERDQRVTLKGNQTLDELIIHADRASAGQVDVKDGIVNVNNLILKYTFVPGEWNFLSFPATVNVEKISNFSDLGFSFNNPVGGAYFIEEYNTALRAQDPEGDAWQSLQSPVMQGMRGYAVGINNFNGDAPVEVEFHLSNVDLDLSQHERPFNVSLDLTSWNSGETRKVTVSPVNVDGNSLDVNVHFKPADMSKMPMNYERALEDARFTFAGNNRQALRLTLPDQTPAKVVFFDKNGKKVIKAVRYVSPMAINITDLKPGTYQVAVAYGNATRLFTLEL